MGGERQVDVELPCVNARSSAFGGLEPQISTGSMKTRLLLRLATTRPGRRAVRRRSCRRRRHCSTRFLAEGFSR